jgi:transposase
MLSLEQCMDIKLLHKEGHSIRQIARLTGNSRNTVRRMLRVQHPPRFKTPERGSKLDAFRDYVCQRYEACGLSAVRLLEEIRPMGFTGSIDILRRYLATLTAPHKAAAKLTVRYETPPGQQAQADWTHCGKFADASGKPVAIYAFVMVLSFSRMIFVRFTRSMKLPVLIDCHQRAFAFFGGWPATMLYDNMKEVKLNYTQWNPLFLDFAGHYGFAPKTHRPYRPRTKGKVERAVHYLDGSFLRGREFADMDDLNAQGLNWCEHTANVRVHGTTQRRPVDLWPAEQLTALSTAKPYRLAEPITRTVDREAMVAYGKSRYSVPPEHSGKTVAVQASAGLIIIRCGDLIIAEHEEAVKPRSSVVLPEHAAALWKMSLQRETSPPPSWQMRFTQEVASRPLENYEVAA